jgi:hypothetical protein
MEFTSFMKILTNIFGALSNRFQFPIQKQAVFSSLFETSVFRVASLEDIAKFYQWKSTPYVNAIEFQPRSFATYHLNGRRLKDASLIAYAAANAVSGDAIEVGTSTGEMTSLIAENMLHSTVHTLDILPSQLNAGKHITHILNEDKIGAVYRKKGMTNVQQHYCDSLEWNPEIHDVAFAFIDGCHDFNYVINDTLKIKRCLKSGAYLCWHDFNPDLAFTFPWILPVCQAIDHLLQTNVINTPILYLHDSFTGICRID